MLLNFLELVVRECRVLLYHPQVPILFLLLLKLSYIFLQFKLTGGRVGQDTAHVCGKLLFFLLLFESSIRGTRASMLLLKLIDKGAKTLIVLPVPHQIARLQPTYHLLDRGHAELKLLVGAQHVDTERALVFFLEVGRLAQ